VLGNAPSEQRLVVGHPFSFDVTQQGTSVTDADGDPLTYRFVMAGGNWGLHLPPGLSISGTVISGTPTEPGFANIYADVSDPHSGSNSVHLEFGLRVAANSAPAVISANSPQLVTVGAQVEYDAAKGGAAFRDADGDAITYAVTLRGNPHGLTVSGTRISGTFDAIGATEFTITASDAFGGVTADSFLIAAPAVEPASAPVLPAISYIYRDEDLPLPHIFRMSSESRIPLWDTQRDDNRTTNAGATLGRVLFYDKRLSITNTLSCGSCHEQGHGFGSPRRFDAGVLGVTLPRHSMPLTNVRYNINAAWFSDMRARGTRGDLRDLIFTPIDNHDELGMALYSVESKLQSASFYPPLFAAAFGTPEITRDRIAAALAQFAQSRDPIWIGRRLESVSALTGSRAAPHWARLCSQLP
jgi:hypothetical protein